MTCGVCGGEYGDVYYAPVVDGKARWGNSKVLPCLACILRVLVGVAS